MNLTAKVQAERRLPPNFFLRPDVVQVARDLLGQVLVTCFNGQRTAGIITETEAYRAPDDRACHAWGNRLTPRTRVMFEPGGRAYIYLCYGIHHMFNVVTGPAGMAQAVLVRAIEPLEGLEWMLERRGFERPRPALTTGPGALGQALGLSTEWTGQSFFDPQTPVWIERGIQAPGEVEIDSGPRIGVDYAGECAAWPWRFWLRGNVYVKRVNHYKT